MAESHEFELKFIVWAFAVRHFSSAPSEESQAGQVSHSKNIILRFNLSNFSVDKMDCAMPIFETFPV
jgi:hypothetical protein